MDPVEHIATEQVATPAEQAPPTQERKPVHQVCQNCGYHDVGGGPADRCPACYFRHASEPVHQAPVKEQKPAPEVQDKVNAADPVEAEDKSSVDAVATEEALAEDEPADEEDKPADEAVGGQTVRVVEKIVIVEKAPVQEKPQQTTIQDATQTAEEQG